MGNLEFHPESDSQLCGFDAHVFTARFPELATIVYSSILGALLYLLLIGVVLRAKRRAMLNADSAAAAAVVLPSYLPVLYMGLGSALTQIFVVLGYGTLCDSSYLDHDPWLSSINPLNSLLYAIFILGYEWFANTLTVLFFLRSISRQSFARALGAGLGIAFASAVMSGFAIDYVQFGGNMKRGFEYLMMILAQVVPLMVLLLLCCRPGTRSSAFPLIAHGLAWRMLQVATYAYFLADSPLQKASGPAQWITLFIQAMRTAAFPLVVYRTLLLDTWYWRGVPRRKHLNADALRRTSSQVAHPEAAGGMGRWLAQPRYPPHDPANDRLQQLLDEAADLVIDHAFLSVDYDSLLGRGASASVFKGTLTTLGPARRYFPNLFGSSGSALLLNQEASSSTKRARVVEVAIKMYTPPQLDEEAILAITEETAAWGELSQLALRIAAESGETEDGAVLISQRPANIVRFFGMCVMPPHLSLVFEFCEGGALSEWISRSSPPPPLITRLKIALDCALAVHFLHAHRFIHRDIKAANFLLKQGSALLTDFGTCVSADDAEAIQAPLLEAEEESSRGRQTFYLGGTTSSHAVALQLTNSTVRGNTVGTIDHMSPELLVDISSSPSLVPSCEDMQPKRVYSSASDVYALAVVIASVLTFKQPFPGLREWAVRQRVLGGERPFDVEEFVLQHDPRVADWLKRAFATAPTDRPSAVELVEIFEARLSVRQQ